ncbi:uncharacterized protein LOC105167394 [Sesamum indicum]|uniref:Uncharacterized protein LOC105167394 n=1 Tax=Sesamum indicum TaxID=4182 RepID=A0A6I9TVN7_SESIN|nr:uncharacterized protein LOC105167394 [Sesamum indicum]
MEVFEKVYKKKEDRQWSGPRVEEVAEMFLRLMEERQRQQNHNEELPLSSEGSVAPNEQQVWMSATGGWKRGRVFGLGIEAHHSIIGPSQVTQLIAPSCSPPQPQHPDIDERVLALEHYIESIDPK